jgi:hypothetical protein
MVAAVLSGIWALAWPGSRHCTWRRGAVTTKCAKFSLRQGQTGRPRLQPGIAVTRQASVCSLLSPYQGQPTIESTRPGSWISFVHPPRDRPRITLNAILLQIATVRNDSEGLRIGKAPRAPEARSHPRPDLRLSREPRPELQRRALTTRHAA